MDTYLCLATGEVEAGRFCVMPSWADNSVCCRVRHSEAGRGKMRGRRRGRRKRKEDKETVVRDKKMNFGIP